MIMSTETICQEPQIIHIGASSVKDISHKTNLDQRDLIVDSLRGQRVSIADLNVLFADWPQSINPDLDALRKDVDETLISLFPAGKRLKKLQAADSALFASMWWPHASPERLRAALLLSLWLFAWDDETDSCEFSDLGKNFKEAQSFRSATLNQVRRHLGLEVEDQNDGLDQFQSEARTSIMEFFALFGESIRDNYTLDQRESLMQQIKFFVDMSTLEQEVQLSGEMPSIQAYQQRRMGSSAVAVCLAIHEYTLDISLPEEIMTSPEMKSLWDETNIIISVCNDILSIRKELAQNQVDSLIPVLYAELKVDAQVAMDVAVHMVKAAKKRFDMNATKILAAVENDPTTESQLSEFVDSCRYACTANLNWSLGSGRYKLDARYLNGEMKFTL